MGQRKKVRMFWRKENREEMVEEQDKKKQIKLDILNTQSRKERR